MDNQSIIDEIKAKLTKNKESDVSYLETELIVFKTLKNEEVIVALEQLLFSYLSKEEKEAYDIKTHEILSVRYDDYQQCIEYLNENKLDEAIVILNRLIKTYEKIENVKTFNYYDFEQMIEYITFCQSVEKARKLNVKRYPEPITYYCYQLANIYIKQNKLYLAIEYLKRALKFNPTAMYVREELINMLIKEKHIDEAITLCKDSLKIAYTLEQLASLYQALGLCYYIQNDYETSLSFLMVSYDFNKLDETAKLISELKNKKGLDISKEKARQMVEAQKVNYGPSIELIDAVKDFISYLKKIKDFDGLKYLLTIMSELTHDFLYQEELEMIQKKEQKQNEKS